jgi:4-oxalomesaconate tautomerase
MQKSIPFMLFRGGSSKALFFHLADLPADETTRDKYILAAMEGVGQGDLRQIDGMGGATSLTSKVAIVSLSKEKDADLDYLFLQVVIGKGKISTTQTCGNILAAVVPFAIESGLIKAKYPSTTATVNILNTGGHCEVTVETPNGIVNYNGQTKVDGVPGTSAPIHCNYLGLEGATCGSLFPTGNLLDLVDGISVTCIDNGMPQILIRARDLLISGNESPVELNSNEELKRKLEHIRLQMGPKMNLGDVTNQTIPKMCMLSDPLNGGAINTRTFIPHVCHEAIGVLSAVSTATACLIEGTVANKLASFPSSHKAGLSIEHPSGEFTVQIVTEKIEGKLSIKKSIVLRTARLISMGEVYIPKHI